MPNKVENKLKKEANKKGMKGKKADAYVYGTLQNLNLLVQKKKKKGGK